MAAVDDGRKRATQARTTRASSRGTKHIARWLAMFFAATSLLPLSSTAGEPTHRSSTARLLYGWSWGGIQVYDLERGVILGGLSGATIIPRGFVLGKTNAFVLAGRTVYDYRIGSLTATRTLPVGSDSLIGETDGYLILQNESMVLRRHERKND